MSNKVITIITVVYNSVDLIEETVQSILKHDSRFFEYVVIDGGSTDGTLGILNQYASAISTIVSEPDKGIYDAMNKGIQLSTGEFIGFINCGDQLLYLPVKELSDNRENFMNCFPVQLSSGSRFVPVCNWTLKIRNTLPHQGCFYKNTKDISYSTYFKVFSDFDLNQKIYKKKNKIQVFSFPVVAFHDEGGISHDQKYGNEIFKVVKLNFGILYQLLSWTYFKKQGLKKRLEELFTF